MIDYVSIRDNADEAINEAGQPGYLRKVGSGNGNEPWDPGTGTPTDYPVVFALFDYNAQDRDGTLIQRDDQMALIRAGGLSVEVTDDFQLVNKAGKVWEVVKLSPLAPGSVVLLYMAQVRR